MATRKKRALVLTGAGASLEFGAPGTAKLTKSIEEKVFADEWMTRCGGDRAYREIHETLAGYLQCGTCAVNFEHVYHCAHELLFTFQPTPGAVNEYRPLLVPFIERRFAADKAALRALVERMSKFIFAELSEACDRPARSFAPLAAFVAKLRKDHTTRLLHKSWHVVVAQAPAFSVARAWRSSPSSLSLLFIDRIALPAGRMMRPAR